MRDIRDPGGDQEKRSWVSGLGLKGTFRFRKSERIVRSQDFRRVMRSGRRLASKNFVLFLQGSPNSFHRLGIVVKKEVGSAPFRNRVKRYVREFFRLHKHHIRGSADFVVLVKKGCSFNRYGDAEGELRRLFIV